MTERIVTAFLRFFAVNGGFSFLLVTILLTRTMWRLILNAYG